MRLKRCSTILLVLCFIATITLSLSFMAENLHHDCTGDDCVICQVLETAEEILSGGKSGEADAANPVFNLSFAENEIIDAGTCGAVISTPVTLCDLLTI